MDRIRIVMAEDHVMVRQSIRQFLDKEEDFSVIGEAGDGVEAVRLTSELKPDVLLLDVAMPKLNGIEVTKQVKACCPAVAVLALTAYDSEQYIFALLEAGAAGYLLKDASGQELVEAIRSVNRGESVLYPTIASKIVARFRQPLPQQKPSQSPCSLNKRELEVLKMAAKGMSNKEIATEVAFSLRTVESQFKSIFDKLGVSSRTEAVVCALKHNLFSLVDLPTH